MPCARRPAVGRQGDVDGLLDEHPLVALGLELGGACRERRPTSPRAAPTRWPAAAFAAGGSAPISRLASASGDLSPACARRADLSSSSVVASANACRAAATAASIASGWRAATSTGS